MVQHITFHRQPLLSAAQLSQMAANGTSVNTLGLSWINPTAADRANVRAQVEGIRPLRLDLSSWAVASSSKPGTAYRVTVWAGNRQACSCECGRAGGICKHIAAVRAELAKSAPVAPAVPAPKPASKLIIAPAVIANREQAERYIEAKITSIAQLYGDD